MKRLLVISNHNPALWDERQRAGWHRIDFYPFPNVPPYKSIGQIIDGEVKEICERISNFIAECNIDNAEAYVTLQGEFSVCCKVFQMREDVNFIFPTTERVVEEVQKEDGSTEKKTTFKFIMWR